MVNGGPNDNATAKGVHVTVDEEHLKGGDIVTLVFLWRKYPPYS